VGEDGGRRLGPLILWFRAFRNDLKGENYLIICKLLIYKGL
jgi:hypothetical protein